MVRKSALCRLAGLVAFLFCSLSYGQPTLSSPTNGAVNQPLAITLAWTATAGTATYTVQIALSSSFSPTLLNETGIAVTDLAISGLSNGTTYYWRAEYGSGSGGWSRVWSFGTVPPAPGIPSLNSPSNGAGTVSLSPNLSWTAVTGAASYAIQVSSASGFVNFVFNQTGVTVLSQTISGLMGSMTYYWRVSATNVGGTSAWSSTWSFGTLPAVPMLISPTNNAQNQRLDSVTLAWSSVADAYNYTGNIGTSTNFNTSFGTAGATTRCTITNLAISTTYYWKVSTFNGSEFSAYSSIWSFTTTSTPVAVPLLALPANGSSGLGTALSLTWNSSTGANSYAVQVSSTSGFTNFVTNATGITTLSSAVTGLAYNTEYFWRVNASNSAITSSWSSIWSFSTSSGAPAAPVLSSPSNGSYIFGATTTLSWSLDLGATSYDLQVSSSAGFATTAIDMNNLTATSEVIKPPFIYPNLSTLYWRVNATNSGGTSSWSSIWDIRSTLINVRPSNPEALPPGATVKCNELAYSLRHSGPVAITVSDILGRRTLLLDRIQAAGSYTLSLKNFRLPPGAYILHFKSADLEKRMIVMLPGN